MTCGNWFPVHGCFLVQTEFWPDQKHFIYVLFKVSFPQFFIRFMKNSQSDVAEMSSWLWSILYCCVNIKLITNRWAWALVPSKLVEPGNALAWGGGIHGNPGSGPHQAPSHWTIQWNTYRPNTYLAHTKREGGMGKTKAQTGKQTASNCNNTLRRTASKQLRI